MMKQIQIIILMNILINDEYLNYTTREDEDEDDITLFDMYEDDE